MTEYYKNEFIHLVERWPIEELEKYIVALEGRIKDTKEQITLLRALIKRRNRNKNPKDTGVRGGK